jgi:hypothetical protein
MLSAAAVLAVGALAAAAPVPKLPAQPAPKAAASATLCVAKSVGGGQIEVQSVQQVTRAVPFVETIEQNGQQVNITRMNYVTESVPVTTRMNLTTSKITAADGKDVSADDAAKRLGDGGAVVQVQGAFDPEWRKLFADDVLFLETPVAQPRPAAMPAVRLGAALPAVAPPPPPRIEKK